MKKSIFFFLGLFFLVNYLYAQMPNIQLGTIANTKINFAQLVGENSLNVIIFYSPECPICKKSALTIQQLATKYAANKVNFMLVYPANFSNRSILKRFQKKYQITSITGILDKHNELVNYLHAQITPECFLLNSKGEILYAGKIDNQYEKIGKERTVVTDNFLADAIQATLDNNEIIIKRTEAVGCFIRK